MNLMEQFKRDNKSNFRSEYKIKNPTHLVNVVQAIHKFPRLLNSLNKLNVEKIQINEDLSKLLKDEQLKIAYKIIWLEANDKRTIINILNTYIFNNKQLDCEMEKLIKTREQGLDYAVSLGILDDYYDYLETGKYNGPVTRF